VNMVLYIGARVSGVCYYCIRG